MTALDKYLRQQEARSQSKTAQHHRAVQHELHLLNEVIARTALASPSQHLTPGQQHALQVAISWIADSYLDGHWASADMI